MDNQRLKGSEIFRYRLLSRMREDCLYFLGYGCFSEKILWSGSISQHLSDMRELLHSFPDDKKPEWLSEEDIDTFAYMMNKGVAA